MTIRAKVLFLLLLTAIVVFLVWQDYHAKRPVSIQYLPCANVTEQCGDTSMQIRFSTVPVPMQPFQVQITHAKAEAVEIELLMQDMPMGMHRYRLIQTGKLWTAQVMLPICMQNRSDWQMRVMVHSAGKQFIAQIDFQAQSRANQARD